MSVRLIKVFFFSPPFLNWLRFYILLVCLMLNYDIGEVWVKGSFLSLTKKNKTKKKILKYVVFPPPSFQHVKILLGIAPSLSCYANIWRWFWWVLRFAAHIKSQQNINNTSILFTIQYGITMCRTIARIPSKHSIKPLRTTATSNTNSPKYSTENVR